MKPLRLALLALFALLACDPTLPGAPPPAPAPTFSRVPADDPAPPVLRVRVGLAAPRELAARLVSGSLTDAQRGALAAGAPSDAVLAREVPLTVTGAGAAWSLAPAWPLEPGEHTLVLSGSGEALPFVVGPWDPWSLLRRVWPASGGRGFAVLCGEAPLPAFEPVAVALEGSGDEGLLSRGLLEDGGVVVGDRCVRWTRTAVGAGVGVLPPALAVGAQRWYLDPAPLTPEPLGPPEAPLACTSVEIPFGPGCATVLDDRAVVRTPPAAALWALSAPGGGLVRQTAGEALIVAPLPPSSAVPIQLAWAIAGEPLAHASLVLQTLAPAPHLVVSEVLANPLGPEPDGEWVELVNVGQVTVALEDYRLRDGGGEQPLPGVDLEPGAYAVLVHAGAALPEGLPPDAVVVPLDTLGTNGLSNAGEPVSLVDGGSGAVVSTLPATPKPKEGKSVARSDLLSGDDDPGAFAVGVPTPGAPNLAP